MESIYDAPCPPIAGAVVNTMYIGKGIRKALTKIVALILMSPIKEGQYGAKEALSDMELDSSTPRGLNTTNTVAIRIESPFLIRDREQVRD